MKAAVLKTFGSPLGIETVPDPVLGTGEVIVDVVATRVLSYANEVFSGERKYLLDLPVVPGPGAIGRVRAVGPDATHLVKGEWGERMKQAASGPIDCVLDIMPPSVSTTTVRAALMTVRPYGRVVLMGGVGMLGGRLELPYPWIMRNCISIHGAWMYPAEATVRLVGLIRSGLLRLEDYDVVTFDLDHANDAVAHAAANAGPFRITVIRP